MQTKLSWKFRYNVSLRGLLLSTNIARGRRATSHPREGSRYEGGLESTSKFADAEGLVLLQVLL